MESKNKCPKCKSDTTIEDNYEECIKCKWFCDWAGDNYGSSENH